MIILRRIFLERIVLRRIYLRRIILEFNFSEEDISGNDSSEEDKSEEDISRNNGSEEDICEEDFSKRKASGEILSEVMTCMSRYFDCRLQLFIFKFLPVSRNISTFFKLISIKLIPWFSINWCTVVISIIGCTSPRMMYD